MKKIILLDNRGRFHVFAGAGMAFHIGPEGCEIMDYNRQRDKKIAHFAQYQWVKEEEVEGLQGRDAEFISHDEADQIPDSFTPPEPHAPDPFTAKALAERDAPVLDHNSLAPGTPIEGYTPATPEDFENGDVFIDTDGALGEEGAAYRVNKTQEEDVPQLSPEEQQETFAALKEQYGDKIDTEAPDGHTLADSGPVVEESADVTDEVIQATLDKAEADFKAKQQAKAENVPAQPVCATCGGDGTVLDEDSDDPLDTCICPDC